jgi:hypothetical protein
MKIHRLRSHTAPPEREGAALLLSLLILLVLVAIVIQINVSTGTDARVARNDVGLTGMDLATESALLQVYDKLKSDAEGGAAGPTTAGGAPGADANSPAAPPPGAGGAGAPQQPSDSRRDDWAMPQRTEINEIKLRIIVQDEDSKYNVLNMLNPDPVQAQAAFDRVVKILDLCREGTTADIDPGTATQMAKAMLDHMQRRKLAKLPRPKLLSDSEDPNQDDQGLPLSLKEFAVLEPFEESHFRDFRDENEKIVHSIGSFLTVWSSIGLASDKSKAAGGAGAGAGTTAAGGAGTKGGSTGTGGTTAGTGNSVQSSASGGTAGGSAAPSSVAVGGGGTGSGGAGQASTGTAGAGSKQGTDKGGFAVNVNTSPPAVLKSLFDDRELHPRFWDKLIEWRNLEDEEEKKKNEEKATTAEDEVPLDEYGRPILKRNFFDSLTKLGEVDGYKDLDVAVQAKLNQLLTTQSNVFSIYIIARRSTSVEGDGSEALATAEERRLAEQKGDSLVRVVRSVVWRHKTDDKVEIVPIVRWEVIDYEPWEVLDYPDEER